MTSSIKPKASPSDPTVAPVEPVPVTKKTYTWTIAWPFVFFFAYVHIGAARGLYMLLTGRVALYTILWNAVIYTAGFLSMSAGAHRLWSHRSYKAKWPLRVLLMMFHNLKLQGSIYDWSRDHRVHHKFVDTDADPYNINRGFFFAHIGWYMLRKHPEMRAKTGVIDYSDLERDSVIMFQKRYYWYLAPFLTFVMPALVPVMLWGEDLSVAWHIGVVRYALFLHVASSINSISHIYGMRPFDKSIMPTDSLIMGILSMGEGWHNYHHVFPWDYKPAELCSFFANFTLSGAFIEFFARIGWAYDLKTVPTEMIRRRMQRTGDGSHPGAHLNGVSQESRHSVDGRPVWGWGDEAILEEDLLLATVINKAK